MPPGAADIDLGQVPRPILAEHAGWVALNEFAWQTAARHRRETRGRIHMDAAWDPRRNYQWVWDTCFMALYTRYAPRQLPGIEGLDFFYDLQRDDGYISMTYDMDSGMEPWPDRINPPLFAWAEWEHFRTTGDRSRLPRAVGHIERLMEWIDANRRTPPHARRRAGAGERDDFQLYHFEDCGSAGMDDAPRTPRSPEAGRFFDWIDLSSQMALSFRMLALIRGELGDAARAAHWYARFTGVGELVNDELWCEATQFYHDRMLPRNFVSAKTAAGFWPVLAGFCPEARIGRLVEHLCNPSEFGRLIPVPSLSADDPNYSGEGVFWRGGVWAPATYMVVRGLLKAGQGDVAHEIACRYLAGLERVFAANEPHTLWESCAPDIDRPGRKPYAPLPVKPDYVGWSGLGPIAMLLENVIGIDVDAAAGIVGWTVRLTEEHGVTQLPVGGGATAEMTCAARRSPEDQARVRLRSGRALHVRVSRGTSVAEARVDPGSWVDITV